MSNPFRQDTTAAANPFRKPRAPVLPPTGSIDHATKSLHDLTNKGEQEHVGMGEGLALSAGQGLTSNLSDEMVAGAEAFGPTGLARALTTRTSPITTYKTVRDAMREKQHDFSSQHGGIDLATKLVTSLPVAMATGGGNAIATGAGFGAANAFGNAEGSMTEQAKSTAIGAGAGGATGGILANLGRIPVLGPLAEKLGDKLPGGARRQATKAAATIIDPAEAKPLIDARQALNPTSTVLGDLPDARGQVSILAKSRKTAINARTGANQRVEATKATRKAIGAKYDDLERPLDPPDNVRAIAEAAGTPLPEGPAMFSTIKDLRSNLRTTARKTKGPNTPKAWESYNQVNDWLRQQVPEIGAIDPQYHTALDQFNDALSSLGKTKTANMQAARREGGSNTRAGNRPISIPHWIGQALEPNPANAAQATEDLLFTPGMDKSVGGRVRSALGQPRTVADRSLGAIADARSDILSPHQSSLSGRMLAGAAGGLLAPQLSDDAGGARAEAATLRRQGISDQQLEQELGQHYAPNIVRFIIAATPNRLPQ